MASSSKLLSGASDLGELPRDALFEVLVRLPAKYLCRLRAVCRSWQTLTSDPLFAAAHKGRHHRDPLLVVDYRDRDSYAVGVEIVDLSGIVLRRIPIRGINIVDNDESEFMDILHDVIVLRTRLDVICFTRRMYPLCLWTDEIAAERGEMNIGSEVDSYAFGKLSSVGVYKALCIIRFYQPDRQLCEVITVDSNSQGMWRKTHDPPARICSSKEMLGHRCGGVFHDRFLHELS
uniref:F-box domain-containing protein n=1 Tax=Leersia perrieri TaxID=77586 RepID=A0A0D9WWJ3_9ORYZ